MSASSPPSSPLPTDVSKPRPHTRVLRPALVLENSGSVARDHLASERTFLAYVRTSLLLASTGVALVQLFAIAAVSPALARAARPLGAAFVVFGLAVLVVGVRRYFLVQRLLTQGKFPLARFSLGAVSVVGALIIIVVFGVLVSA